MIIPMLRKALTLTLALTLTILVPGAAHASSDRDLRWYAGLYPQNPAWIQVRVDTRQLATNDVARNVKFSVAFFDHTDDLLGGRNFTFTDGTHPALEAGHVYQRFFPNPLGSAKRAAGLTLHTSLGAGGLSFAIRPIKSRSGAISFAFAGGQPPSAGADAPTDVERLDALPEALPTSIFQLPDDGLANDNAAIGPFCCTGHTATVTDAAGNVGGYIYFAGFEGGHIIENGSDTAVTSLSILLSATVPPPMESAQGAARFDAADWTPDTIRTVQLGSLTYRVTLTAELLTLGGRKSFRMSSARARVEVDGTGAAP